MAPATELPDKVLAVLPDDPFEQLDVAMKITSIALATRVSLLEEEISSLRLDIVDRDELVADLQGQVEGLDSTVIDLSDQLARANEENESLVSENASLSSTVKKLNDDISKLEVFRKTLMQSLKEEDENSKKGTSRSVIKQVTDSSSSLSGSLPGDEEGKKFLSERNRVSKSTITVSDDVDSVDTDASSRGASHGFLLTPSLSVTPRFTPPDSPKRYSASVSPRLVKPYPTSTQSFSFSNARSSFEERAAALPSAPSGQRHSFSEQSRIDSERSRVDGKEFFREVRSRLSHEQFREFLADVKDMNSRKQTREETLRRADEIFGPGNKDLYAIFESLIIRNLR